MVSKETRDLVILSLVTVIVWVLYELFTITTVSTISPEYKKLATSINPKIDMELLESLSDRIQY